MSVTSGWGRLSYGQAHWDEANLVKFGWGRLSWGDELYGDAPGALLTGVSATASVGQLTAFNEQGWGRDAYGLEFWGESADPHVQLTGVSASFSIGTPFKSSTLKLVQTADVIAII